MRGVPPPRRLDYRLELGEPRLPAELLPELLRGSDEPRRVARTAPCLLDRELPARDPLRRGDHLAHREAVPRAEVVDLGLAFLEGAYRQDVRLGQVGHVDVVADGRTVGRIVVGAEDADRPLRAWGARGGEHQRDEMRLGVMPFADVARVIRSGGEIDGWLNDAISSSGTKAQVIDLMDSVDTITAGNGRLDPHWWHDPHNATAAVKQIERSLSEQQPAERGKYARNAKRFRRKINSLDQQSQRCLSRLPTNARKLVTTHEALGYLTRRYPIEVIGTVIPSQSSVGEPSIRAVSRLVDLIKRERVQAIFPEQGGTSKLERAIASQAGVRVGAPLWTDTIGPSGSEGSSYLGAMAANVEAIINGITDGAQACSEIRAHK